MNGAVSVLANRFRQEPCDLGGYDAWQDQEGMLDASDACRDAWKAFKPQWRAARRLDLSRGSEAKRNRIEWSDTLTPWERYGLRKAAELGGMDGLCSRNGPRKPPDARTRRNWVRWQGRVRRHDLGLYEALWRLLDGEPIALVAGCVQREVEHLERQLSVVLKWLVVELYGPTLHVQSAYR